jgi:hypothetical protein
MIDAEIHFAPPAFAGAGGKHVSSSHRLACHHRAI